MDNYFLVKWKDSTIGILVRIDGIYYTKFYSKQLKDKLIGEEIIKQTSFQPDKLYKNDELFEFFEKRLRIETNEDAFDRIRKTGAKRPTDNFWLQEMDEMQKEVFSKALEKDKETECQDVKKKIVGRKGIIKCEF